MLLVLFVCGMPGQYRNGGRFTNLVQGAGVVVVERESFGFGVTI
jgi:hypothetical protein